MSAPDPAAQRDAADAWLRKAADDLATVPAVLALTPPLSSIAAYHLQQAAEKLMKALLTLAAEPFRKTHSLNELGDQVVAIHPDLSGLVNALRPRSTWSFAFRYPMDDLMTEDEPTLADLEATRLAVVELRERLVRLLEASRLSRP